MATATVLFSGPASLNDGHLESTFNFKPPSNISGRSCYLKVTNVAAMVTGVESITAFNTYFITMDLPQPFSYATVNYEISQATPADKRMRIQDGRNNVVAIYSSAGVKTTDGGYNDSSPYNFPRILVEIPDGPQYVKVGMWKAAGTITSAISQLTVMFELTPVDGDDEPDLSI